MKYPEDGESWEVILYWIEEHHGRVPNELLAKTIERALDFKYKAYCESCNRIHSMNGFDC